jgi:flagellar biosynthetic protein FliR
MTDFTLLLGDEQVVNFMLLFVRLSALFVFFPFFSSATIYPTAKAAIAFYLAVVLYPIAPPLAFEPTAVGVMGAVLTEVLLGFCAGFLLQLVFGMLQLAGEQISFVMGFSMATAMDPITQTSSPMISQFLVLFATVLLLAFDGHHLILFYMAQSLQGIPLGTFVMGDGFVIHSIESFGWLFVMGFMIAFPILALSILADVVFGMIMKTVPSFNLLVVGFPAKILVAFIVMVAVMGSIAFLFKKEFLKAFESIGTVFY